MTFVFYRYPYGSTIIDGKRIYGYLEKHPAVRVTWDVFRNYKQSFIEVAYNTQRLQSLFPDKSFPSVDFLYSDLRELTWEQMCGLCKAFGITSSRSNGERRKALRKFLKEKC